MEYGSILQKPAEAAYVVACLKLMPSGILGLVLVAMFAATASSMDTGLNTNAGDITRNILPPIRKAMGKPPINIQEELKVGRRISTALVGVIILIALWMSAQQGKGVFELILAFGSRVTVPMALPFTLAVFFRSLPRSSGILGIIGGLVLPLILNPVIDSLFLVINDHYGTQLYRDFFTTALTVMLSGLTGIAVSYLVQGRLESGEDRSKTKAFYTKMHTPVDFEEEIGIPDDHQQVFVVGKLALLVALLLFLLVFLPNPWTGRLSILAVSLSVAIVGGLMVRSGRKNLRKGP